MTFALENKTVLVAGHRGMVGSAIVRKLQAQNVKVMVDSPKIDLRDQAAVKTFMQERRPDAVVLAAAKVGGINANNQQPAEFLYDNLMIAANVIEAAHRADVEKLLLLGSSCIYPRLAPQPINEDDLLTGALEPTNEWYAIAKIAGIKLCQSYRKQYGRNYIACQPTNLYGENDNFDLNNSHVLPALLRKAHEAKLRGAPSMEVWGTGTPRREFLHVDDLASASVHLLRHFDGDTPLNVGWGKDISIGELAELVADVVGFRGQIVYDTSKPDGTPRKLLDTTRINALGWQPKIELRDGIESYYAWYTSHLDRLRA